MATLPISLNVSTLKFFSHTLKKKQTSFKFKFLQPIKFSCHFHGNELKLRDFEGGFSFLGVKTEKYGVLKGKKKRSVIIGANQFGFNGGGGGGKDNSSNTRVLVNLGLAVGLTYLSMTGQLGWVLDAIVSIWLLAVILPIAGFGAFLWWAGRNIVQSNCPNCGKDFQIFRSSLKDGLQLCPYCTQPFSVEGDDFVSESANFTSSQFTTVGQAYDGFSSNSKKGKASSLSVVDIEAEVTDVE